MNYKITTLMLFLIGTVLFAMDKEGQIQPPSYVIGSHVINYGDVVVSQNDIPCKMFGRRMIIAYNYKDMKALHQDLADGRFICTKVIEDQITDVIPTHLCDDLMPYLDDFWKKRASKYQQKN